MTDEDPPNRQSADRLRPLCPGPVRLGGGGGQGGRSENRKEGRHVGREAGEGLGPEGPERRKAHRPAAGRASDGGPGGAVYGIVRQEELRGRPALARPAREEARRP